MTDPLPPAPRSSEQVPDDDPDVVAGMKRLAEVRELERDIPDIPDRAS